MVVYSVILKDNRNRWFPNYDFNIQNNSKLNLILNVFSNYKLQKYILELEFTILRGKSEGIFIKYFLSKHKMLL